MAFPAFTLHFRAHNIMEDGYRDGNTCDKLLNDGCYILVRHQHLEPTTMFMFNHRSWLRKCSEDEGKMFNLKTAERRGLKQTRQTGMMRANIQIETGAQEFSRGGSSLMKNGFWLSGMTSSRCLRTKEKQHTIEFLWRQCHGKSHSPASHKSVFSVISCFGDRSMNRKAEEQTESIAHMNWHTGWRTSRGWPIGRFTDDMAPVAARSMYTRDNTVYIPVKVILYST